ncbi:MAG: 3'(2'),5'-bisphosphate nucleotidase CysQ, partial [Pseudomonadota bacterium]|nr:3'(2'),5'-bisphosphate nucleotidase CysQ [Pseudomonadota bacterium]
MTLADEEALLEACGVAARAAGAEILKLVAAGFEVEIKSDQSPVTVCDRAAEAIILAALAEAAPGVPVIAEEEVAEGRIPAHGDVYFLVDPLDGTKEFVRGGDDYTVNIGLIVRGTPRLGVVYQPALDRLHLGLVGDGAWLEENGERRVIATRPLGETRDAVASKSHFNQATADYLDQAI